jgi:hypothetical protein
MQHSEQIDKLAGALAKAQAAFTNPPRNREVQVRSDKGSYSFAYATFDAILDVVRKPLTENELSYTQTVEFTEDGKPRVVTTLMHSSGQWIDSTLPLMLDRPGNQAFGSALTYAKRYALTALLGVAADEDDDANSADGNGIERKSDRSPQVKTAAPSAIPPKPAPKPAGKSVSQALTEINGCRTKEEIGAWQSANSEWLMKLADQSADKHTHVMNEINARYDAVPSVTQAA